MDYDDPDVLLDAPPRQGGLGMAMMGFFTLLGTHLVVFTVLGTAGVALAGATTISPGYLLFRIAAVGIATIGLSQVPYAALLLIIALAARMFTFAAGVAIGAGVTVLLNGLCWVALVNQ